MNPLAIGLIVLGTALLLLGIFSLPRTRIKGLVLSATGLITMITPFAISFILAR